MAVAPGQVSEICLPVMTGWARVTPKFATSATKLPSRMAARMWAAEVEAANTKMRPMLMPLTEEVV